MIEKCNKMKIVSVCFYGWNYVSKVRLAWKDIKSMLFLVLSNGFEVLMSKKKKKLKKKKSF
jgi:hypothetical protein